MLPYVALPKLGPVTSFGVLAMLGAYFGLTAGSRHAQKLGLDPAKVRRMAMYCGVGGILGAHFVDLLLYQPGWSERSDAVWLFLNPSAGISSYGGLIGGTLGFFAFALLLAATVVVLRRPRRPGWIVGAVAIGYAVPRFFLDYLRREATDPRYGGLTPAQWSCVLTVAAGLALLAWIYTHREAPPERYLDATPWRVHLREALRVRRRPGAAA